MRYFPGSLEVLGIAPIFFDKFLFCLDQLGFLSVACNPESYLAQQWEGLAMMPGQQQVCNAGSFPSELVFCSYEFARAAITKYHQLRGIKKQHPLVSSQLCSSDIWLDVAELLRGS